MNSVLEMMNSVFQMMDFVSNMMILTQICIKHDDFDADLSIDFEHFADLMTQWQQDELEDVFNFFDDDGSGSISVAELSACIQALGENKSAKEVHVPAVCFVYTCRRLIDLSLYTHAGD